MNTYMFELVVIVYFKIVEPATLYPLGAALEHGRVREAELVLLGRGPELRPTVHHRRAQRSKDEVTPHDVACDRLTSPSSRDRVQVLGLPTRSQAPTEPEGAGSPPWGLLAKGRRGRGPYFGPRFVGTYE